MEREIFLCVRNWGTVDCTRKHIDELHGECCCMCATGRLMGSELFVGERNWETVNCNRMNSVERHDECC